MLMQGVACSRDYGYMWESILRAFSKAEGEAISMACFSVQLSAPPHKEEKLVFCSTAVFQSPSNRED